MVVQKRSDRTRSPDSREMSETEMVALLPSFFDRFFAFFVPAHEQGVVPSRIKELARLKIAAINECDT